MTWFFFDETHRLRTAWRFAIFGVGFLLVHIGVALAGAIGLVCYALATGNSLNAIIGDQRVIAKWATPVQIAISIPMTLASWGLVVVCRRHVDRRSVWSLGLCRPGRTFSQSIAGGFLVGFLPVVFVIGILLVVGGLAWAGVAASVQTALLIPALIAMAFCEEIVCRGYLLQNLIDIRRPVFGILFSSIVFWLLHAMNPSAWSSPIIALNLFGAGIALALAYRVSGNIWFPTAMHFGWNFAQGVLFEVPVSGIKTDGLFDVQIVDPAPVWLTGGAFGIEGSILATFAEIWISVLLGGILWKRRQPAAAEDPVFLEN